MSAHRGIKLEFQARADEEQAVLPDGLAIAEMLNDYAVMREPRLNYFNFGPGDGRLDRSRDLRRCCLRVIIEKCARTPWRISFKIELAMNSAHQ